MTYPPNAPMPPAAPTPAPAGRAAQTGWLGVVAGIFGLLALILPWYQPKLTKSVESLQLSAKPYHAWSGLFILIVGPLILVAFAIVWVQALIGKMNARFAGSADPHRSMAMQSIVAGAVALVVALLSYPLVKSHYSNWDETARDAKAAGSSLTRGVQPGLWLLIVGGVLMLLAGVLALVLKPTAPAQPGFAAPQEYHQPPQQQYQAPQQQYQPPQQQDGPAQQ